MHRRTKKILLGTAGLAVVLAPSIVAAVQPNASIFGTVATATEVKELKDFSGKIDLDPKTKVVNGVGQAGYGANYIFKGVSFGFTAYEILDICGQMVKPRCDYVDRIFTDSLPLFS